MGSVDVEAIKDRAVERFNSGYNCAEAVFMAGGEIVGKEASPSAMTGFGGGIARQGSVCGALTGAIAAIGLAAGRTEGSDLETKQQVYRSAGELFRRFREEFGSEHCTYLCGCDLSTQDGRDRFVREDVHHRVCVRFVSGTVELLAGILSE